MSITEEIQKIKWLTIVTTLVGIWLVNIVVLAVYRLYFSPIAKFPGPKLAALTSWYEFYYEVIQKGRMSFHVQDLHKKYGE
jgi:hypothetical protein